jgi:hypothetical protein
LPVRGSLTREEMAPDTPSFPHTNALVACVLNVGVSSCALSQKGEKTNSVKTPTLLIDVHCYYEANTNAQLAVCSPGSRPNESQ